MEEFEKEEKFDAFCEMLDYMQKQPRAQMINPNRIAEMKSAYEALSKIVLSVSPDAKISCVLHEMNDGSGVIRIETDEIIVGNVKDFVSGIKK